MVELQRGAPTRPIEFGTPHGDVVSKIDAANVEVSGAVVARLDDVCEIAVDRHSLTEASRDWWPLAMMWATEGQVGGLAGVIARPADSEQVAAVLRICNDSHVPVTAAGGRSGVCGASVPVHGGVVLDITAMEGIVDVDTESMVLDVRAGTFGDVLEDTLGADHGVTVGHWPQSVNLSTVGGWLACRGAGQLSNRYGKIEDLVIGLDVVLADGTTLTTGGNGRASAGPDLNQLFVGSEGTLGIITGARLRVHPATGEPVNAAYGFETFHDANDACRRILQRGAAPAVLRVYYNIEADRSHGTGDRHVLLVRNVGDQAIVDAEMQVTEEECRSAEHLDPQLVENWWGHRNDVSGLEALTHKGFVVDTMELTAPWSAIDRVYEDVTAAIMALPNARVASAHQSHAYPEGACLYFTFASRPPAEERQRFYLDAWEAGTVASLKAGASLSHHHGVGMNRSRFMRSALGDGAMGVLNSVKSALDPHGILNPGKLGLDDPFGTPSFP